MTARRQRQSTLSPGREISGYQLEKRIGKGGFGSIWLVRNQSTGQLLAMKAEKTRSRIKTHGLEKRCLNDVQGEPYFPTYYEEAHIRHYDLIFMECLGPSLRKLRLKCPDHHFSLATSLRVGVEMVRSIRALHERGYIHRDIKPDNFIIRPSKSAPIALIDFGLSRRYIDDETDEMIPPRVHPGFVGTNKFASLTAHLGEEQMRRDDIESWYYSFLQITMGTLPWSKIEKRDVIFQIKDTIDYQKLLADFPPQLAAIYDAIPPSGCPDQPPYDDIILLLQEAIEDTGINWEDPYDWEQFNPKKLRRISSIDLTPPAGDVPNIPSIPLNHLRSSSMSSIPLNEMHLVPRPRETKPEQTPSPIPKKIPHPPRRLSIGAPKINSATAVASPLSPTRH